MISSTKCRKNHHCTVPQHHHHQQQQQLQQRMQQQSRSIVVGSGCISTSILKQHSHYNQAIKNGNKRIRNNAVGNDNRNTKMTLFVSIVIRCSFVLLWFAILYYEFRTLLSLSTSLNNKTVSEQSRRVVATDFSSSFHQGEVTKPSDSKQYESKQEMPIESRYNNTKIPHVLIFTHYINLLTTTTVLDATTTETHSDELRVLQSNVHRIIALHTNSSVNTSTSFAFLPTSSHTDNDINRDEEVTVRFLTDDDCIDSIRRWAQVSRKKNHTNTLLRHSKTNRSIIMERPNDIANELIHYFQRETIGMYKADLCRGVALYESGGIYMDVDLGIRMNIFSLLQQDTEFVTVKVHVQSSYPGAFFQAFIASIPYHDVIHRYIELFILHYRGTSNDTTVESGPLGVILLKRAYDEIQYEQQQILQELQYTQDETTIASSYTSPSIIMKETHLQRTTELWQEVLYLPQFENTLLKHVPRPTWGTKKRACNFIVFIPPSLEQQKQIIATQRIGDDTAAATTTTPVSPLIVPMYSRIAGSRMCPT